MGLTKITYSMIDGATVNVQDLGAVGDGVTDDTAAFQAAADAAIGVNTNPPAYTDMPSAVFCNIFVPEGSYVLSANVDSSGKDIVWLLDTGVKFNDENYLGGTVFRNGKRVNAETNGILDHAVGFAVNANRGLGKPAAVMGITHPNQLSSYLDRDTVGFYAENKSPAPITCVGASYTATTLLLVSAVDVSKLRVGMIIDTAHSPNKYSGIVTGWNDAGTVVNVSAWYEVTGLTGVASTPPSPATAYINATTKTWAFNGNVELASDSHATKAAGFELGIRNNKISPGIGAALSTTSYIWCYDAVNFGPNNASIGYLARNGFLYGFHSGGAIESAFVAGARNGVAPVTCFETLCNSSYQINCKPDGTNSVFAVRNTGQVQLGNVSTAATHEIAARTSGLGAIYDSRIVFSGGTATPGEGIATITALWTQTQGGLRPFDDNARPLGSSSNRWTEVFAVSGTINTSDQNEKQDIADLDATEKRVAVAIKSKLKKFRFKDAVQKKGDAARVHVGVMAQEVKAAFEAEGLDAHRYGMFCEDTLEDGSVRLGVRYDELLAFVIAAI